MHKGSCSCGKIQYQYSGSLQEISMCHCRDCRKAQGTAFAAVSAIESSQFEITEGHKLLKSYQSSPNKIRVFCSECGSPIYSERDDKPGIKRLRLGTLDTPMQVKNKYHVFVSSKAEWYEINDGLKQYDKFRD